jgi:serine/threonine protein kinase
MKKIVVGEGGNGRVYRVWKEDIGDFAAEKKSHQPLAWEAIWLQKLQGFAVPEFYEVRQTKDFWILSMEYLPGVTLQKLIDNRDMNEWQLIGIVEQIIKELYKIKEKFPELVFCDLKPSNIIVTRKGNIYFIDFGSVSNAGVEKVCQGTRPYAAPEMIKGKPGRKSDIYSVAQILWQIREWKKDFFYYCVIAPCIEQEETRRQGSLLWMQSRIRRSQKLHHILNVLLEICKKAVIIFVIFIVLAMIIWLLEGKYDIIKNNGIIRGFMAA